MIIVEGMDNSGKTTLVNKIALRFNLPVRHSEGPNTKECLEARQNFFYDAIDPHIFDRLPAFSEEVYGRTLRGESVLDPRPGYHLAKTLRLSPLLIYCRPEEEDIFNFGDRLQMNGVIERKRELLRRYDDLMSTIISLTQYPFFFVYNWRSEDDHEQLFRFIPNVLEGHARAQYFANRLDAHLRGSTYSNLRVPAAANEEIRSD